MNWTGPLANQQAVGARGVYTVRAMARGLHVLTGVGHDMLPMSTLPSLGRGFGSVVEAQGFAEALDARVPEGQVSGC